MHTKRELPIKVEWFNNDCESKTILEIPFIFYVLDFYFSHKDLLKEYFNELIEIQIN